MSTIKKIQSVNSDAASTFDRVVAIQQMMQARQQAERAAAQQQARKESEAPAPEKPDLNMEDVQKRLEKLNNILDVHSMKLSFGIEGQVFLMKVIDLDKGEVVKQVPSKEIVDFLNRIEQDVLASSQALYRKIVY